MPDVDAERRDADVVRGLEAHLAEQAERLGTLAADAGASAAVPGHVLYLRRVVAYDLELVAAVVRDACRLDGGDKPSRRSALAQRAPVQPHCQVRADAVEDQKRTASRKALCVEGSAVCGRAVQVPVAEAPHA